MEKHSNVLPNRKQKVYMFLKIDMIGSNFSRPSCIQQIKIPLTNKTYCCYEQFWRYQRLQGQGWFGQFDLQEWLFSLQSHPLVQDPEPRLEPESNQSSVYFIRRDLQHRRRQSTKWLSWKQRFISKLIWCFKKS